MAALTKKQVRALIQKSLRSVEDTALRKSAGDNGRDKGKQEISISKYFRGAITGNWSEADYELEQFKSVNKALGSAIGTAGGFLVIPEFSRELIELLRAKSVIRGLGPRVYPMSGDTLVFNRQTGAATAYWVAEGVEKTESEETFGQASLVLKEVAGLVKVSNNLIEDASPAVDAILRQDLVEVLTGFLRI